MSVNSFSGQPAIPASYGFTAGKNKIINGDFGIWQRGTSFSNPAAQTYTCDRFMVSYDGTGATRTVSQQAFTAGTAPVSGYEGTYFLRCATTAAGTGNTYTSLEQRIEDVRTFAGQTVTFSVWLKADTARTVYFQLFQVFGSGGSGVVGTGSLGNLSVTTSWQRFTMTVAVPSISGKTIGTGSNLAVVMYAPAGVSTIDTWGWQLEAGSTATSFQTATGTIQGELAACQRYYYRYTAWTAADYQVVASAIGVGSTSVRANVQLPVPLRTSNGISLDYSTLALYDMNAITAVTTATLNGCSTSVLSVTMNAASGLTQYRPYQVLTNLSTSAYIGVSAEL